MKDATIVKYRTLLNEKLEALVKDDGTIDKVVLVEINSLNQAIATIEGYNDDHKKSKTERTCKIVDTTMNTLKVLGGLATPFLLTLMCFGYESEGNGNIFTTTGRQTISNVLRNKD